MSEVLSLSQIRMPGTAQSKDDAIREAGQILVTAGAVTPDYIDSMFDRERSVSTYMGNYLAIPHGTNESKESIKRSALSVIRYPEPIDWDGNEVLFALGIAGYQGGHMDILSKIAILFSDGELVCGYSLSYSPRREGFFIFPADSGSNNLRIFVVASSATQVAEGMAAEDLAQKTINSKAA